MIKFNPTCLILSAIIAIGGTLGTIAIYKYEDTKLHNAKLISDYNEKHRNDFFLMINAQEIKIIGDCSKNKMQAITLTRDEDGTTLTCDIISYNNNYTHFGPYNTEIDKDGNLITSTLDAPYVINPVYPQFQGSVVAK